MVSSVLSRNLIGSVQKGKDDVTWDGVHEGCRNMGCIKLYKTKVS